MTAFAWGAGVLLMAAGVLLVAGSFLPDDAITAIPLPEGTARRALRPVGIAVMLVGLALPPMGYALRQTPVPPTPTATLTPTETAFPTIPLVPTVTPVPPSPTPRPTRGTPAPVQPIRYMGGTPGG